MSLTFNKNPVNSATIAPLRPSLKILTGELSDYASISVSRDTVKQYFDSDSNLSEAAVNKLQSSFDPADSSRLGWKGEESRKNEILDSRDMTTASWFNPNNPSVARDTIGIDGKNNTACTVIDDDGSQSEWVEQSITISDDSNTHVAYAYVKKDSDTSRFPRLLLKYQGGSTVLEHEVHLNTSTGILSGAGSSDGNASVEDKGDFWRVVVDMANNGTGNTTLRWVLMPADTDTAGSPSSNTTGSAVFDQAQDELNTDFPSSSIITGDSTVTRSADDVTLSDFSKINTSQGTFKFTFTTAEGSGTQTLFDLYADANNRIYAERNSSNEVHFIIVESGTTQADINLGTVADDTQATLTVGYKKDDIAASLDGAAEKTDTSATIPTTTAGNLMRDYNDANYWNGYLKDMHYWKIKRSNLDEL